MEKQEIIFFSNYHNVFQQNVWKGRKKIEFLQVAAPKVFTYLEGGGDSNNLLPIFSKLWEDFAVAYEILLIQEYFLLRLDALKSTALFNFNGR